MLPVLTGKEDRYPYIFRGTRHGFLDLEDPCDKLKYRNVGHYFYLYCCDRRGGVFEIVSVGQRPLGGPITIPRGLWTNG